jgi:hypothetical protein
MKSASDSIRTELKFARQLWRVVNVAGLRELRQLLERYHFSVALGEVIHLNGRWYVTHSGLLQLAYRRRCGGIKTTLEERLSDPLAARWVFKATVYKRPVSKGFVGYGDADPSNVSPLVRGAEMRVAETRAVNRALRKAYGIGLCSVEELGWLSGPPNPAHVRRQQENSHAPNGSNSGQPRLRDRLCLLIRQYNLDPTLVKAYAADFCGTPTLKDASRNLVESFISHLATSAKENRDGLVCKLNSYAQPAEAKP